MAVYACKAILVGGDLCPGAMFFQHVDICIVSCAQGIFKFEVCGEC